MGVSYNPILSFTLEKPLLNCCVQHLAYELLGIVRLGVHPLLGLIRAERVSGEGRVEVGVDRDEGEGRHDAVWVTGVRSGQAAPHSGAIR